MPEMPPPHLSNTAPVTTLRGWIDALAAHDRLAIVRPGVDLRYEREGNVLSGSGRSCQSPLYRDCSATAAGSPTPWG